jgi:hypothetical protein
VDFYEKIEIWQLENSKQTYFSKKMAAGQKKTDDLNLINVAKKIVLSIRLFYP